MEKVTAASLTTIGGNTSGSAGNGIQGNGDGCYRKTISRSNSRIYGYVRPRYRDEVEVAKKSPSKPTLRKGHRGSPVAVVQNKLRKLGYGYVKADKVFGDLTQLAIKDFQARRGLEADGVVNASLYSKLGI